MLHPFLQNSNPKKILIIQTAFLGDLILTTAFIRAVKKEFPNSLIRILVAKGTETILDSNPDLDSVLVLDKKKVKKNIFYFLSIIRLLRSWQPDLVFLPHFSFRSSILGFLSKAKLRVGYVESGFSFLHTHKVRRPRRGMHEVDKLFSLLYENSYPQGRERRPYLYFSKPIQEKVQTLVNASTKSQDFVLVSPSSIWETKRYPEDMFAKLIFLILKNTHLLVVLSGSPKDINLCQTIINQVHKDFLRTYPSGLDNSMQKIFNFAGKTNLIEMAVLVSMAKAVICNDSAPIHYASAFNIPSIQIYGATVPDFGYTGLMDRLEIAEIPNLYCRPCGIHGGNTCPEKHFRCMKDQKPEEIFEKLKKIL